MAAMRGVPLHGWNVKCFRKFITIDEKNERKRKLDMGKILCHTNRMNRIVRELNVKIDNIFI